jgi:beta-glucosidase
MPPLLNADWLQPLDNAAPDSGLTLSYYHNMELAGEAAHVQTVQKSEASWFGTVNPFVDPTHFSMRLEGTLTVPSAGTYQLHLWTLGRGRLWVDGELVVDHWQENGDKQTVVPLDLKPDKPVAILVEYITQPSGRWRIMRLGCLLPAPEDPIQAAVDLAAKADTAVIVAGLSLEWESEGFDRVNMALPGLQNELISRVAAVNANTIVVLNAGSALEMPWIDEVPAVLQQWYGGQDAGHALADVLFGDVTPSGKLPTTFPKRLKDNPAFINYPGDNGRVHYGEGIFVGYRYYDMKEIAPLFPFGHGLSYTTFRYENLRLNGDTFGPEDEIIVTIDLTNSGQRIGQEVVQLYLRDEKSHLVRPLQELKAFTKVVLEPGQTKTVTLELTRQSLAFYDTAVHDWVTEPGAFTVRVGSSSRDIRLEGQFNWSGDGQNGGLHTDLSIGNLLENEHGSAVLRAHLGDMLNHPQLELAMSMSLEQIANFVPDVLTAEKLAAINDDLTNGAAKIPANPGVAIGG